MTLQFEEWLNGQQGREDEIGALARVPSMRGLDAPPAKRAPDEHKRWVDIVVRIPDGRHISVFNDAWREYLVAKKADHDHHD